MNIDIHNKLIHRPCDSLIDDNSRNRTNAFVSIDKIASENYSGIF